MPRDLVCGWPEFFRGGKMLSAELLGAKRRLWTLVKLRKQVSCVVCYSAVEVWAWKPLPGVRCEVRRWWRICHACVVGVLAPPCSSVPADHPGITLASSAEEFRLGNVWAGVVCDAVRTRLIDPVWIEGAGWLLPRHHVAELLEIHQAAFVRRKLGGR